MAVKDNLPSQVLFGSANKKLNVDDSPAFPTGSDQTRMEIKRMLEQKTIETEQRAQKALSSSPIFVLRQLQVEQYEDCLLLSGSVDNFYHKQLAQEVVRAVSGGMEIVNSVNVD